MNNILSFYCKDGLYFIEINLPEQAVLDLPNEEWLSLWQNALPPEITP